MCSLLSFGVGIKKRFVIAICGKKQKVDVDDVDFQILCFLRVFSYLRLYKCIHFYELCILLCVSVSLTLTK